MTGKPDLLTVNPLFYDALSGEFVPFGADTKHTLGRLMIAAFQKGECILEDPIDDTRSHIEVAYTPSWANRVTATVGGEIDDESAYLQILRLNERDRRLTVTHLPEPKDQESVWLTHTLGQEKPYFDRGLSLALGPDITAARSIVAREARNFFGQGRISS